ncbi:mucolipin-3-like [Stegodyphus dumicola]|uniref:mucolipin-3-like n=1 Tax=Stegodyphus dumicola TaxID=202533 RepID=UPI0015ACB82A|nr:mucolipin-3-like [Stegodyphus dumicola]
MDNATNTPQGVNDKFENSHYVSPYVEISGSSHEFASANSSLLLDTRGSVNSFLDEAEIIHPVSDRKFLRASYEMRKKLKYFFMNPIEKWNEKSRFPWKLCLQIVKIVIATLQVVLFGYHSYRYVKQHFDMTTALSRIFLKDWSLDVAVYPPSNGPYAAYTVPEFFDNINYVIIQYSKVVSIGIGPYGYDSPNGTMTPLKFCAKHYDGKIIPENLTVEIKNSVTESCLTIPLIHPTSSPLWDDFSLENFLHASNFSLNFKTLIDAKLYMQLKTLFIKSLTKLDVPECYKILISVLYDNSEHDGQLPISLSLNSDKIPCHIITKLDSDNENVYYMLRQLLNCSVIIFCMLSAVLCLRSLYSGRKLANEADCFFKRYYRKCLSFSEYLDFIDFWYVNIIISDILLIFGSLIKMQIEEQSAEGMMYTKCSILLGVGNLQIWIGLLRYLGFFPKYNMLILTLKRALPNILRFLLCAVLLYTGFSFCGWIVLAPFHVKFQTLSRTVECLFAVMNGDDMFATFALVNSPSNLIWWFSRIYLYAFLLLFIYVVISLCISVIMDTFENIKHIYRHGEIPQTTVEIFLSDESYTSLSPTFDEVEDNEPGYLERAQTWLRWNSFFQYTRHN